MKDRDIPCNAELLEPEKSREPGGGSFRQICKPYLKQGWQIMAMPHYYLPSLIFRPSYGPAMHSVQKLCDDSTVGDFHQENIAENIKTDR